MTGAGDASADRLEIPLGLHRELLLAGILLWVLLLVAAIPQEVDGRDFPPLLTGPPVTGILILGGVLFAAGLLTRRSVLLDRASGQAVRRLTCLGLLTLTRDRMSLASFDRLTLETRVVPARGRRYWPSIRWHLSIEGSGSALPVRIYTNYPAARRIAERVGAFLRLDLHDKGVEETVVRKADDLDVPWVLQLKKYGDLGPLSVPQEPHLDALARKAEALGIPWEEKSATRDSDRPAMRASDRALRQEPGADGFTARRSGDDISIEILSSGLRILPLQYSRLVGASLLLFVALSVLVSIYPSEGEPSRDILSLILGLIGLAALTIFVHGGSIRERIAITPGHLRRLRSSALLWEVGSTLPIDDLLDFHLEAPDPGRVPARLSTLTLIGRNSVVRLGAGLPSQALASLQETLQAAILALSPYGKGRLAKGSAGSPGASAPWEVGPVAEPSRRMSPMAGWALVLTGIVAVAVGANIWKTRRDAATESARVANAAASEAQEEGSGPAREGKKEDLPSDPEQCMSQALATGGAGQAQKLARLLKHCIRLDPDRREAYVLLDRTLFPLGDLRTIITYWDRYLERHPDDAVAIFERSGTYFHNGNPRRAMSEARRACDLGLPEACQIAGQTPR